MTYEEIESLVGKADRSDSRGLITGKEELHYKIEKTDGIVSVVLAFEDFYGDDKQTQLLEAKMVYNDRRVEDLPLE